MTDYITPITVHAESGRMINLGRAGEHLATTVSFNVANWLSNDNFDGSGNLKDEYSFTLFVQQNGVGYYVQPVIYQPTSSNRTVRWPVMNYNTQTVGLGKCELMLGHLTEYIKDNVIYGYYNSSDKKFYEHYSSSTYSDEIEGKKDYIYVDQGTIEQNKYYYSGDETTPYVLDNNLQINQTQIIKSVIYDIVVTNAVDADAESDVPSVIETWLNQVTENMALILNAQGYAQNAQTAAATAEEYAGDAEDFAGNAENFANLAEAFAKGTVNNEPVESGNPGYHDNAKYYAEQIEDLTVNSTTGEPGTQATVTKTTVDDHYVLNFTIPRGNQGAGLNVIGHVNTVGDLPLASQAGAGAGYGVGTTIPYDIYFSDGTNWTNYGPISGGVTATSIQSGQSDLTLARLNIRKYSSLSEWNSDFETNQGRNDIAIIPPSAIINGFLPIPANPQDGTVLGYDSNDGWIGIEPLDADLINITDEVVFGGTALITSGGVYTALTNKQDTLPSQTGNSGKYLTTNGTTISWGATDNTPTSSSTNLVTSGGVYTALNNGLGTKQDQIVAKTITIDSSTGWDNTGHTNYYEKDITSLINDYNLTVNTKIDIQLNANQYLALMNDSISGIYIEVKDVSGTIKAFIYTISAKPSANISSLQITIMEAI